MAETRRVQGRNKKQNMGITIISAFRLLEKRSEMQCTVKAGEIIGIWGILGYGDEGTRGKFQVHLHFGVYVRDKAGEKSINPYYLLKKLESR